MVDNGILDLIIWHFQKKNKLSDCPKAVELVDLRKNNNQVVNIKDIQRKNLLCPLSKLVDWLTQRKLRNRGTRELKIFKVVSLSVVDLMNLRESSPRKI